MMNYNKIRMDLQQQRENPSLPKATLTKTRISSGTSNVINIGESTEKKKLKVQFIQNTIQNAPINQPFNRKNPSKF
jgi:hypothetical protein